jgi:uncharacterized membrane protein
MAMRRLALLIAFVVLAAIAGLLIGFAVTYFTFENQFQQVETAKFFLVLVVVLGALYLIVKSAKGNPNEEL